MIGNPDRPNILLYIMDACQAEALHPDSPCHTPNFDRLAARGIRFDRAYCPSPTCSPSRSSLMTGLLPHNHGVLEVEHGRDEDQVVLRDKPHWAQLLRAQGYVTGYYGKWHIERSNELQNYGWDHYRVKGAAHHAGLGAGVEPSAKNVELDPELTRYHTGPEGYNDILHYGVTDLSPSERYPAFTVGETLDFIRARSEDESWCAAASFSEPNEALVVCREMFDLYRWEELPLPENLCDNFDDRPNLYQRQQQIAREVTEEEWRMARACYYGRITEVDAEFGRIYNYLEKEEQLDKTLVIVCSDHGRYVGAHGFDAHNWGPFEEIYRIPMLVAGPGVVTEQACGSLVGLQDIGPTILEYLGISLGEIDTADSTSFAAVLRDPSLEVRDTFYAENHGTRFALSQRVLWRGEWKYAFNGFDFDELYHLQADPYEMKNLIDDSKHKDVAQSLMRDIWNWMRESNDRTLLETHYFSMRIGGVGPNSKE